MNENTSQTQVFVNGQMPQRAQGFRWSSIFRPKFIFLILSLIIAGEIFLGIRNLQGPLPPAPKPPLPISGGSAELISFKDQISFGEKFLVQARVSTGGNPIEGADVIIRFDPKYLSLAKADLRVGKIFPSYPLVEVDEKKGLVSVSGTSSVESFNGIGTMAEMEFLAKERGKTKVALEFKKDVTSDSNVVDSLGIDILENVKDLELEIK